MFQLKLGQMSKGFCSKVGEYDPFSLELIAVRHHLPVRDVGWVVAVEERGFAYEEVGALGHCDEMLRPPRVAGVGDELSGDLDTEAVPAR